MVYSDPLNPFPFQSWAHTLNVYLRLVCMVAEGARWRRDYVPIKLERVARKRASNSQETCQQ